MIYGVFYCLLESEVFRNSMMVFRNQEQITSRADEFWMQNNQRRESNPVGNEIQISLPIKGVIAQLRAVKDGLDD
jgi:hypothetical protein